MLGNRTFLAFLLFWLLALGASPALLKSTPPPASHRPEPIEVEPETLNGTLAPASVN